METRAVATFEINAWEEAPYEEASDVPKLSRVTVRKTFQGDIIGTSVAELLTSGTNGYVALERVVGRVGDRSGTFDVLHCAINGGSNATHWLVVPGSGTGELQGILGEVTYKHDEDGTTFTLDYHFEE